MERDMREPFGSYSKGNIYIVDDALLPEIMASKQPGDVVILERRGDKDPNMQIQESYKIHSPGARRQIAEEMCRYNTMNPVSPPWIRTVKSIMQEWRIHNWAYALGYMRKSSADCDFNNSDEGRNLWGFFRQKLFPRIAAALKIKKKG